MKRHLLLICFFILLLTLIFVTYKDYGVPWDEKVFFNTGKYYTIKILDFVRLPHNLTNNGFEPTPYHLRGHGVFMDILTVFSGLPFRNFNFETLHLIRALYAIPIFLLLYWIVNKLLNQWYALLSLIFLLIFPRFYPEIFYNAVDIPTALLFTICLAYFIYYAQTKHTVLKSILFGFILGITINQRLLLFYLPIVNFVFLGLYVMLNSFQHLNSNTRSRNLPAMQTLRCRRGKFGMTNWFVFGFLLNQFVIFLSTIFFMHLTHPYLLTHPITGLFEIISHARQYPWNAAVLFDGQFYQAGVKPLPWYYLSKSILITTPLIVIVLFLLGNIKVLTNLVRPHQSGKTHNLWLWVYIFSIFYLPFLLVFILKPTLYDSWRQFLFLSIPLIIISILGLQWLFENLKLKNWKLIRNWKLEIGNLLRITIISVITINFILTAKTMLNLHPYEYLYYNSLVGGLKGAYGKYETDYWGLGYKESVIWFNKKVNDPKKQYQIFVEGDPLSSSYYFKPNMKLTLKVNEADFIFTFTRWNFHLRHPGKTIYTVERESATLIFIKKL